MPGVDDVGRGDVKTPPLWHTAAKMQSGRWYTDGSFHGPFPLMASSMELEKDRPFDALVHIVMPTIKQEFDSVIRHLQAAAAIRTRSIATLAERGRALFYSQERRLLTLPRRVRRPRATSTGRACTPTSAPIGPASTSCRDGFIDAFDRSPLAAEGSLEKSRGLRRDAADRCLGQLPYLHNGSVPTLYHLLGPGLRTPADLQRHGREAFRSRARGQVLYLDPDDGLGETALLRRFGDDRNWFNTARPGCGNGGHRHVGPHQDGRKPTRIDR